MPYLVGPDIYSRVLCADGRDSARRAALMAAGLVIPISFLLAALGVLIRGLFPGVVPDTALTTALTALAPVGVKGIIVAGILGAVMSSADTTLISASTIMSVNVVGPSFSLDETARLRLTRVFVVLLGGIAWALASYRQEIIGSLLLAYTVFVGGVVIPTLASFWRKRLGVTASAAFWAVVAGGSTALVGEFRDGAGLDLVLGAGGRRALEALLGPGYGSLLPLLVSALILALTSWLFSGEETHG
jgi:SSS family solute:Na+ symporter